MLERQTKWAKKRESKGREKESESEIKSAIEK